MPDAHLTGEGGERKGGSWGEKEGGRAVGKKSTQRFQRDHTKISQNDKSVKVISVCVEAQKSGIAS